MDRSITQIKNILESLYEKYNRRSLIPPDPLQFVYRFSNPADMELAALIASSLAYGRVKQIEKSLNDLFKRIEYQPFKFISDFNPQKARKLLGFKHRFNTDRDIIRLFEILSILLHRFGSVEKFFLSEYNPNHQNIIPAATHFASRIHNLYAKINNTPPPQSFRYLIPSPEYKSPCKRLNLFLRWMIRDDDVDTGIWKSVPPSKLIYPIDTHIARLSKILGFHTKKTVSLKTAVQITLTFAKINPKDPVKYDFALSRVGIIENCTGKFRQQCECCQLLRFCLKKGGFKNER